VSIAVRLLLIAVGVVAIAVAVSRFRRAVESADEAERVGTIPRPLRSVFMFRMAALMTGAVGVAFIVVGTLIP
jgi:hypothetical protein